MTIHHRNRMIAGNQGGGGIPAVFNPDISHALVTFSNENRTITTSSYYNALLEAGKTSGKHYMEFTGDGTGSLVFAGCGLLSLDLAQYLGAAGSDSVGYHRNTDRHWLNGSSSNNYWWTTWATAGAPWTLPIILDADSGTFWAWRNTSSEWRESNPAFGWSAGNTLYAAFTPRGQNVTANTGQEEFLFPYGNPTLVAGLEDTILGLFI